MAQVFRKCLVVRNLDVGSKFSKSHHLNCVTMEGDQVSDKGAVSGGYLDVRRSRLQAQLDVVKLGEQASDHAKQKVLPPFCTASVCGRSGNEPFALRSDLPKRLPK